MTDATTVAMQRELTEHLATVGQIEALLPAVSETAAAICARLGAGGRVLAFGNGGSAADAQHLVAELIGRFARERRPLAAVSLTTDPSVLTCIANDFGYDDVFARQVTGLATAADVVIAFSTSGTSPSIVRGLAAARELGALTILLTGEGGAAAATHADLVLRAASSSTPRIQETHVVLVHLLSELVDRWAAEEPA